MPRPQSAAVSLGRLDVNDLVRVNIAGRRRARDGEAAAEVRTRVEDVVDRCAEHDRRYLIAAPHYAGDVELPKQGTPCTLEWPGQHGIWVLPVAFVQEQRSREGLRTWTVEVIALPRQTERRSFVRVHWDLSVTIETLNLDDIRLRGAAADGTATMAAGGPSARLVGRTCDISEGGVRCVLPAPALPVGSGIVVELEISGHPFKLSGRVQRVRPASLAGREAFDTAVAFDDADQIGDRLRPLLFAEQLRLRRAGLE